MTAPHFHTTKEVVSAIKRIGHNDRTGSDGATEGAPTGIAGGSTGNKIEKVSGVTSNQKGDDYVSSRSGSRGK